MCLMHTDFPVPDGPRIIEILLFGMPMLRPRRILLRPNALCTSTNSTASSSPCGRWRPVCHWYSSSGLPSSSRRRSSSRAPAAVLAPAGAVAVGVAPPLALLGGGAGSLHLVGTDRALGLLLLLLPV